MAYLKQDEVGGKAKRPKAAKSVPFPAPVAEPIKQKKPYDPEDKVYVSLSGGGLSGIENAVYAIADHFANFTRNAAKAENKLAIFTGEPGSGQHPVLIALESSDTMDEWIEVCSRIAAAFERIADAMNK